MIWIEIVTIGTEILKGRTRDTNFSFLAERLARMGLPCKWHTSVPDQREPLSEALERALARADVVIATGGLGPTPDDITRKVLATVLHRQLVLREDALEMIQARYARLRRTPPANVQAQALIPLGADLIENEVGTAPGMRLRSDGGTVLYVLPGVPYEMESMAASFVLPEIESAAPPIRRVERVLKTAGIPESALVERIAPILPTDVEVAYLPHLGTCDLYFAMEGEPVQVVPFLDRVVSQARERIGPAVYGEKESDSIEQVLGHELSIRGWSVAVAESLTGGALGARIVRVPGASHYFMGGIVAYSNDAKSGLLGVPEEWLDRYGAVSEPVARAMAHGARSRFAAEVGIAATGIAGPTGETAEKPVGLVFVAVETPNGGLAQERRFPGGRDTVIRRSVLAALDLARRVTCGLPVDPAR